MSNTVVASNDGSGIRVWDGNPTLSCCDVYGNLGGNYANIPDPTGTNGNISEDPLFCDTTIGDYSLADRSPCLAANNPCGVTIGAYDVGCYLPNVCIWVDSANVSGPWDGSTTYPFQTIGAGVDTAVDGDTIMIAAGTYTEQVTIDRGLRVLGYEGRDQTRVNDISTGTDTNSVL